MSKPGFVPNLGENGETEMPRYQSHKEVHALKIEGTSRVGIDHIIIFQNKLFGPIKVDSNFFARGMASKGDYYVVYADGYASWSPAKAFEEGYKLVS